MKAVLGSVHSQVYFMLTSNDSTNKHSQWRLLCQRVSSSEADGREIVTSTFVVDEHSMREKTLSAPWAHY
eukprot:m.964730 g.964730  ORF g.964730 m.964730 type:complete len:70 (-) comp23905_c0_seq1:1559-1768(-)